MSHQIDITEVARGFDFLLTETFEEVRGAYLDKGDSLFETLASITAADASQPMGACATIAAHVAHIEYYLRALEDRLFKRDLSWINWDETWQAVSVVDEACWAALQNDLRASYTRLKGHLAGADKWTGTHELSCLLGVIAHSAYHLGEIRQMTCRLRS